jgi:hypothetical protein
MNNYYYCLVEIRNQIDMHAGTQSRSTIPRYKAIVFHKLCTDNTNNNSNSSIIPSNYEEERLHANEIMTQYFIGYNRETTSTIVII